jgi:hypothetical protein
VGVKLIPLTPTLSHGGERENEVKSDYLSPSLTKWLPETLKETFCMDIFTSPLLFNRGRLYCTVVGTHHVRVLIEAPGY